ncbi:ABC transporter permease [Rhizohabitans arisaemae]|uniref:ABC transporter permease n=1 Tax=Rhizohabitans arisaemae TaxID=2720610 RepID=UPI0024B2238E|nr:ABC transporter permease subunit [Rhizohabitans arisaemae]
MAIAYLLLIPLATQILTSLRGPFLPFGTPTSAWGLGNYTELWSLTGGLGATLRATAVYVLGATAVSCVIAWPAAWLVVRTDLPGRGLVYALMLIPLIIPPIVHAQSWTLMLAPKTGLLNQMLRALPFVGGDSGPIDPFDFAAFTVLQGLQGVTFLFILLVPILSAMDGSLEEAGRMAGASTIQTIRRITLPLVWPATLGVLMLGMIITLGQFEIPLLFGQREGDDIFAMRLWRFTESRTGELPRYGAGAAFGVVFLVVVAALFLLYMRLTRRADRLATITGKGFRAAPLPLGTWRIPAIAFLVCYLGVSTFLPMISLVWSAITPYVLPITWGNLLEHATFGPLVQALGSDEFWAALGRTLLIAALSATLATILAAVSGWTAARGSGRRGPAILNIVASSSIAIPATMAGFAAFLFYLVINRVIPIYGTIWVLVLAYAYRMAVAHRIAYSGVLQISPALEEAAAVSGAGRLTVFRRIMLPLLMPILGAAWLQLFLLGAQEFTIAVFLSTPETRPLPVLLFTRIDESAPQLYAPNLGAAMAVVYTVLMFAIGYGWRRLARRLGASRTSA